MADDDEFFDYGEDDDIEEDDFNDEGYEDEDEDQYFRGSSGNHDESSSKDLYQRLQQAERMAALENNGNLAAADEFDVQKMLQFRQ